MLLGIRRRNDRDALRQNWGPWQMTHMIGRHLSASIIVNTASAVAHSCVALRAMIPIYAGPENILSFLRVNLAALINWVGY